MTDEERKNLDPNSAEFMLRYGSWKEDAASNLELTQSRRVGGSKTQIAGWITYSCLVLWPAKAAMCTFYVRLTV